ncbi:thioesterase family protein [Nocardia ninae]|uniref:Acyl-CoA thioesterase n=1 Tax=Nocardia ninae NBRC 108245 TaxID=1210091 RepID=A0A511MDR7_9NOCA|nr:thioesterase family protein [Nocardia ninae]GEM38805.1 hypothetical protein NN4_33240 [Nocardia ninae NBRC 108245]
MTFEKHALLESSGAIRKSPGEWVVHVPRTWWSWSGPLGGLLNALAAQAGADLVDAAAVPQATHTQFLRNPWDAPISLIATVERAGRTAEFVTVRGTQGEDTIFISTIVFAHRTGAAGQQRITAPSVPAPEDCPEIHFPPELVPFGQQFELRQACGAFPMTGSSTAEMGAWLRMRPEVAADSLVAIVAMDAMPPGLYPTLSEPLAIVSTELSIHLHGDLVRNPIDDFVLAVQRNITSGDGWCVDEASLWDRAGGLVASSRQLRRILDGGK